MTPDGGSTVRASAPGDHTHVFHIDLEHPWISGCACGTVKRHLKVPKADAPNERRERRRTRPAPVPVAEPPVKPSGIEWKRGTRG